MFQCFVIAFLKWMKYKNRLTFAYYSTKCWDFKSLQSVSKTWKALKTKTFSRMSKYRNTVFYDYQSRFLVIFSTNYRHRLVFKIPFPDHIFPKISKYRTENLHFQSTGKYYALPPSPHKSITSLFIVKTTWSNNIFQRHDKLFDSAEIEDSIRTWDKNRFT